MNKHWTFGPLGRRGSSLLFLGFVLFLSGVSLIGHPPKDPTAMKYLLELLPFQAWGYIWMLTGSVMVIGSLAKTLEVWGFGLASFLFSLWGTEYAAVLAFDLPLEWGGLVRGVILYYGFAVWLQIIAGWPEPNAPQPEDYDGRI